MDLIELWNALLGTELEPHDLAVSQVVLRAVVVYVVTVAIVQIGKKRFMGRGTAFDVIVGIILGSIVSRAITGNAPLAPALAAGATLVLMHWLFSAIALHWHGFGTAIKGRSRVLVRDGEIDVAGMRAAHITPRDLREGMRESGIDSLSDIAEARLERNGSISIIKAKTSPKIVDIRIEGGVQTVRLEVG